MQVCASGPTDPTAFIDAVASGEFYSRLLVAKLGISNCGVKYTLESDCSVPFTWEDQCQVGTHLPMPGTPQHQFVRTLLLRLCSLAPAASCWGSELGHLSKLST